MCEIKRLTSSLLLSLPGVQVKPVADHDCDRRASACPLQPVDSISDPSTPSPCNIGRLPRPRYVPPAGDHSRPERVAASDASSEVFSTAPLPLPRRCQAAARPQVAPARHRAIERWADLPPSEGTASAACETSDEAASSSLLEGSLTTTSPALAPGRPLIADRPHLSSPPPSSRRLHPASVFACASLTSRLFGPATSLLRFTQSTVDRPLPSRPPPFSIADPLPGFSCQRQGYRFCRQL
jgi:hypothetical protein